ncbi:MAG: hypothetical protein ACN2B6_00395 [Rickettsiales bacterium]
MTNEKCSRPNKSSWKEILLFLPFSVAFLDTFFNYFLTNISIQFRVGILSLGAVGIVFLILGAKVFRISEKWILSIFFIQLSFLIGIFTAPDIGPARAFQIISISIYFYCGYLAFRWTNNTRLTQNIMIILSSVYITVCVLALLKVNPAIFPVIDSIWSKQGILESRPEITTDQNFQVFYLLPAALAIVMPLNLLRFMICSILVIGALYVLSQIQTRSGVIAFFIILFLGLLSTVKNKNMGRKKLLAIPIIGITGAVFFLPYIISAASLIIYRFTEHGYATAQGRLDSTLYLFTRFFDVTWWLPQGNSEFLQATGNVPHTNVTAFFLEAGIIGLVFWIYIIVIPTLSLGLRVFFRGRLDPTATVVCCASLGVLALQLTLNAPVHSQVWLWAGAVIAINERLKHTKL